MNEYYIAWWNLENLFDIQGYPQRPDWLQQTLDSELNGWDQTVLNKKITQLSTIIKQMNNNTGPDILGVCEAENKHVAELLRDSLNSLGRQYEVRHWEMNDKRGIDIAFIYDSSKFSFDNMFSHIILKRTATRDLLQINLKINSSNKCLILVGNHWPSRSGGVLQSEPYRILAGETLSYWHERIHDFQGNDVAIVFMGDFNDEPPSRSMTQYALSTNNVMKVKNSQIPRKYNLMWPLMGEGLGTYYFNNFPNMLDQFLVSKGCVLNNAYIKIKPGSVKIERFPGTMEGMYNVPKSFGRPSRASSYDENGFSDHFPISMVLQEV